MNRAARRAASKGRESRFAKKAPASLMFAAGLDGMLLSDFQAVQAFRGGWADVCHFDSLLEYMMMIQFAANDDARLHPDTGALTVCELVNMALLNIRDRYDATGGLSAEGDELRALDLLAETAADFWPRQAVTTYARAWQKTGEWKREAVNQKAAA